MNKKGDMTISTVIKAVLVLIVLAVLVFVLARYTKMFTGGIEKDCVASGGTCSSTSCLGKPAENCPTQDNADKKCGFIQIPANCGSGICCIRTDKVG